MGDGSATKLGSKRVRMDSTEGDGGNDNNTSDDEGKTKSKQERNGSNGQYCHSCIEWKRASMILDGVRISHQMARRKISECPSITVSNHEKRKFSVKGRSCRAKTRYKNHVSRGRESRRDRINTRESVGKDQARVPVDRWIFSTEPVRGRNQRPKITTVAAAVLSKHIENTLQGPNLLGTNTVEIER